MLKLVNGEVTFKGKVIIMAEGGISFEKHSKGEAPLKVWKQTVETIKKQLKSQGIKEMQIHVVADNHKGVVTGFRTKGYRWIV